MLSLFSDKWVNLSARYYKIQCSKTGKNIIVSFKIYTVTNTTLHSNWSTTHTSGLSAYIRKPGLTHRERWDHMLTFVGVYLENTRRGNGKLF